MYRKLATKLNVENVLCAYMQSILLEDDMRMHASNHSSNSGRKVLDDNKSNKRANH